MARHVDRGPRRAVAARPSPPRIVLRPEGRRRQRLHRRRARTPPTARSSASSASGPSAGCARPTSPTTRPSATSPTGWPGSASRRRCSRPARVAGADRRSSAPGQRGRLRLGADADRRRRAARRPARHRPAPRRDLHRPTREEKRARLRRPPGRRARAARDELPPSARPATGRRPGREDRGRRRTSQRHGATDRPRDRGSRRAALVVKVGSSSLTDAGGGRSTRTGCVALVDVLAARRLRRHRRSCWSPPAPSRPASARSAWPGGRATWPPSRPRPASGRAPSSRRTSEAFGAPRAHGRAGAAHRRRRDPAHRTTPTPGAPSTGCSTSASCPIVNENDTVATARDPVRRQRPAGRARRPPRPRRRAAAALRRRRAVRRAAAPRGHRAGRRWSRGPGDLDDVAHRRHRLAASARGGMVDQGRGRRASPTPPGITTVLTSTAAVQRGAGRRRRRHGLRPDRLAARLAGKLWLAHATTPAGPAAARPGRGARRSSSAARRCCRRASPPWRAASPTATRSTCATPTGRRRPRAGQLRPRPSCRGCSAAPPATWPASSAPATSARSSTATTSSCCERRPRPADGRRGRTGGAADLPAGLDDGCGDVRGRRAVAGSSSTRGGCGPPVRRRRRGPRAPVVGWVAVLGRVRAAPAYRGVVEHPSTSTGAPAAGRRRGPAAGPGPAPPRRPGSGRSSPRIFPGNAASARLHERSASGWSAAASGSPAGWAVAGHAAARAPQRRRRLSERGPRLRPAAAVP